MMSIVFDHSVHVGIYMFPEGIQIRALTYIAIVQIAKFGTIAFFLLAGFLLGSNFTKYSPLEYFKRRLSNTVIPWLIWSLFFVTLMSIKFYIIFKDNADFDLQGMIGNSFYLVYLQSNYWFIINFLICIGILLLFKKHLYSIWLGAALLALTIIYSLNIYYLWFPPMHTMALFGFVFFLWLGAQFNKNWTIIKSKIDSTPNWLLGALSISAFGLAIYETTVLYGLKSIDPYNTLRFSNVLYSIVCIWILLKIKNLSFTKYLKPRETTYGIFLIHYIIVFNLIPEILRPLHIPFHDKLSGISIIGVTAIRFIVVYSLTFGLVSLLNKTKLKWLIGR